MGLGTNGPPGPIGPPGGNSMAPPGPSMGPPVIPGVTRTGAGVPYGSGATSGLSPTTQAVVIRKTAVFISPLLSQVNLMLRPNPAFVQRDFLQQDRPAD